jgi:competence protein ComEC
VQILNEDVIIEQKKTSLNPPLVIPAILFATGIVLGNIITSYFYFVSSALIFSFLIFFYPKKHNISKKSFIIFLIIFLPGFISIIPHLPQSFETKPVSDYFDKKNLNIVGVVASKPVKKNIRTKFVLQIEKIEQIQDDKPRQVEEKIEVYSYRNTPELEYGDVISFTGSIIKPRNFSNPGGFDYLKYLSFKGIAGVSFVSGKKIMLHMQNRNKNIPTTIIREVNLLRGDFAEFIQESTDDYKVFSILCALTTGLKNYIPENLRSDFSRSGTAHVLAISGLHLSTVAAISFLIFNYIFSGIKPLLIRGLSGKFAALATLFPLLTYAFLSGFSPSTRRAFIMIAIYMISFVIKKEKDVLNSLAAAAIIILIIDPTALFAVSFQLSFSAVLFIILGVHAAGNILPFKKKNMISRFSMFVIVSFCAGLGTMPIVMYYFNIVSFVQVLANIVIIPVVGFIVVPLGLAAFFIFPFSEIISGFLIKLATPFLSFSISFTEYLSSSSFAWSRCVTPHLVEIFCYYAFIFGIYYFVVKKSRKAVYLTACSVFLFMCYTTFVLQQRYFSDDLKVTVLDVGQGNSALIEGPKGARILVDGGGASYNSTFDTGRYLVAPFLWYKKITTLDAVILTHPERDHMNGLIYIVENFKIEKFIKNSDVRDSKSYIKLMQICSKRGIPVIEFPFGKKQEIDIGKLNFSFLFPLWNKKNMDNLKKNDYNNNSLVFKVKYKEFEILFPGDIMEKTERKLVRTYLEKIEADVLIAPHHGSSTSSSSAFLDAVKPQNILISCGWHNRYNFPDNQIIDRYNAKHINFYRTDYNGAIEVTSNGRDYNISTFKGD